ncbi:hypothetical protein BigBertha_245 [Bacillus phage BigBertha]|uniref:Uncharacterized protein n=5 Tax=Caudoviricetes TaxID=2731619 RepID=A0A7U3T8X0_9CAUD|nr:hypothetical protein TROLL_248 [Bacillus phage Troll]YP_008771272.1 hypothetical protein BigBertha_245 [Bacillus phage BigBertha]YP_009206607.1 hypothetical protein AVV02_gp252 [Bacillus phage AvesoBmore]QPY77476.1 hypothetical protein ANTHOS_240 [Bacillus phage Anthos]AGT13596.1 hypothetical protein TROLL_248 [Bacillus phage Troll]AGY46753.1 hypothetical protein BigBertha_245 [Bacillus phage BigBertha]ALA13407.1 hypothetical protein AVESOBMORE_252 [Bacillus phage AvesoBmore]
MSKNIIIELINGDRYVNDPELGMNLDSPEEIAENLYEEGKYELYREGYGYYYISNRDFARAYYEETQPITIVDGGHKYVKLQHVFELMKHAENMWSLPYYEFDALGKTKQKIDNTMAWLERNAKTKEELKS